MFNQWKIIFGLLFYNLGVSQQLSILHQETNEPLDQVQVRSMDMETILMSDEKGRVDISVFKEKSQIEFKALGFITVMKTYDELLKSGFSLFLEPMAFQLGSVVVAATRWKQKTQDVPAKAIAISRNEMRVQNPQTAADLLGISGKVFIQKSQQGGGSPMIRGFATNRLLYAIDGVRMNTAIFRGGNIQNVISLDPLSMERVELVFGPGSVIYGSDAIGGVMSFQTLTPELSDNEAMKLGGSGFARYASANHENTGHVDLNVGWKHWALNSSFSYNDFDDLRMGNHGPDEYLRPFFVSRVDSQDVVVTNDNPLLQKPSAYAQFNWMQKLRFRPNDRWDVQLGVHGSETSPYARYDRHIRYRKGLPRYGEWSYGPQIWNMVHANIDCAASNALFDRADLRLAYQRFEESRISRNINELKRETRLEQVNALSANWDLWKNLGAQHTLYYGMEWVNNEVMSNGIDENIATGVLQPGPSRYPQADWSSIGLYLTDQWRINEQVLVQAGVRYNHIQLNADFDTRFYPFPFTHAAQNHGALTGSLGVVYRPTEEWVISLNAAKAFRSPNVDDMGKVFDSAPGTVTVPNPNLKPEYAYNLDLGVAKIWGQWLKVDVSVYYTFLDHAMVRRNFALNGLDSIVYDGSLSQVQAIQNAASAYVYGLQAGLELKLPGGFKLISDFNYQQGEEELEDGSKSPLRHAAPVFGTTRLEFKHQHIILEWYLQYSGGRPYKELPEEERDKPEIYAVDANGDPYAPAWYTLNFKTSFPISKMLGISAGLENITDQRYRPYSSGISAAGRNFILSVHAKF